MLDKNGAIQKIFILENTDVRTKSTGEIYGVTGVLAKSTNYSQIHDVFLPEKLIQKFKESVQKSIIVRKYSQKEDGFISLTDSSTIMDTTDDISQEDITKFLNPDIVDIATIKTKKRNERVSLQGIVEKSTRIIETPQSSRKIYTIADTSGNIDVKFWGDKTSLGPFQDGTNIKITALKVDQYGGRCSLNSTPSTAVQINEDYDSLQGDVQYFIYFTNVSIQFQMID
ncbi:uncharacterized protein LOC134283795 [Saccostrea cucullata]|uniref:uncharacterized protein LOC134283795 n=1 Tax=Saccostrea cuccullata TaxID=36930 RepID=UPI002ED073B4